MQMNTSGDYGKEKKNTENIPENAGTGESGSPDFIREHLKNRPVNRRKIARRLAMTAVRAVVFGAIACVVFMGIERVVNRRITSEQSAQRVTVPEESAQDEMLPEDMIATDKDSELFRQREIDQSIRSYFSDNSSGITEYNGMYSALRSYVREQSNCLVDIESISVSDNWIAEEIENEDRTSGVVISKNTSGIDILACYDFSDADRVYCEFRSGGAADAMLVGYDESTGISVIRVAAADLSKKEYEAVGEAKISPSGSSFEGKPIAAIGSPSGAAGSMYYGMIVGMQSINNMIDRQYTIIDTDIIAGENPSGILIDLSGNVLGIIGAKFKDNTSALCAVQLSELSYLIETLTSERKRAYFGIRGTDVPAGMTEDSSDISSGVYVIQAAADSPALRAGIQNGDIITNWGFDSIMKYSQFVKNLQEAQPGDQINITYMRYYDNTWHKLHTTCILE